MINRFPIPLFLSLSLSVFVLLLLGTWQLNKHFIYKKNNLIFELNSSSKANELAELDDDIDDLSYIKLVGAETTNKTLYLEPRTMKGKVGFHKISVVKFNSDYLLVNEGFTLTKNLEEKTNIKKNLEGYIIKIPQPKFFELKNDIENKIWYSLKIEDFESEFNLKLSPYIVYEQNLKDKKERISVIPNLISKVNHLNYALTWYFLCISLCAIFLIYFKKNYYYEQK